MYDPCLSCKPSIDRVRVQLARDRSRGGNRGGGGSDGQRFRQGIPPGRKTQWRVVVENISSRTSWQVGLSVIAVAAAGGHHYTRPVEAAVGGGGGCHKGVVPTASFEASGICPTLLLVP